MLRTPFRRGPSSPHANFRHRDAGWSNSAPRDRSTAVLVVEDDDLVNTVLQEMMRDIGYRHVISAKTERDALQVLEDRKPALVLLDANLFGIPSHRVAEWLRTEGVPFVVVTGFDPDGLPAAFAAAPALRKPVTRAQLSDAIRSAISDQAHRPS